MGQEICTNKNEQQLFTNKHKNIDDFQIPVQQYGDNPSKEKLNNNFLKTQVVASWNILKEKILIQQENNMKKSKVAEANNSIFSQLFQDKQDNAKQDDMFVFGLQFAAKLKRYTAQVTQYQNIQVDVSNFIKIKTQNVNLHYEFKQKIGQGSFGNVYKAIQLRSGQIRAVKALKKKSMNNNSKMSFIAELDLLKTLDHPNIIKLYDLYLFEGNFYVVTQYCQGGCLQKYFTKKKGNINQEVTKIVMKQLLSVISYMNNMGVVHRDLKLQNLVFVKKQDEKQINYGVKLIDFGTAIKITKHKKNQSPLVGTLLYIAPQYTKGFFTEKCDIWSSGVILYLMLFNEFPFKGKNQKQILNQIVVKNIQWQALKKKVTPEALEVVKMMLDKNYLTRPSAKALLQMPWIQKVQTVRASKQVEDSAVNNLANFQRKNNFVSVIQSFMSFKKITQQQRQQLSKMFISIDKDNSGMIECQQLIEFIKQKFPNYKDSDVIQIVQNVDKNNSGKIDFNEFITAMIKKTELYAQSALIEAFDYIDGDKTGYISKKQIKGLLRAADKKQIEQMFDLLDQNHDNKITFDQFRMYLLNC